MRISIIVPIYNAVPYLQETIQSVVDQKYKELEIILVNDGSTDNSERICLEFSKLDSRIIIINKENGGLSTARNAGLYQATGDYLWFVDADDQIVPGSIEKLTDYLKGCQVKPDILFSNTQLFTSTGQYFDKKYRYDRTYIQTCNADELLEYLFTAFGNIWSVWSHLYNHSFIRRNHISFNEQIKRGEDFDWMFKVILSALYYDAFYDYIYLYRIDNNGSIHKQRNYSFFYGGISMSIKWFRYFEYSYQGNLAKDYLMHYMAEFYNHFASYIPHIDKLDRSKALSIYRKNSDIIEYYNKKCKNQSLFNFF